MSTKLRSLFTYRLNNIVIAADVFDYALVLHCITNQAKCTKAFAGCENLRQSESLIMG